MSYNKFIAEIYISLNYSSLTVEEHMLFFGQLKGMSYKEVKDSVPG